ncbi:CoA binding domain containing protein [Tritrichomonas foetus]|uniref:CoA binding domain containing protein n=1 Tax=Tritrichomonas foetus TaxID=1144522 RepID=A0A1J4J693_9EUKA|nr:CoA binding domain containing protein [Tritrichomonas foetus]|eukprot:OHS94754.1 CoA binding domain containing protein [Tritrichomonas foetus]
MLRSLKLNTRSFAQCFSKRPLINSLIERTVNERPDGLIPEHEVYSILGELGFSVASHHYATKQTDAAEVVSKIDKSADKLVAKGVIRTKKDNVLVTHKTDIGALQFNIPRTNDGINEAMKNFKNKFNDSSPYNLEGIVFVEQVKMPSDFGTEMLVSAYQDPFFGPTVCYGFGGTIVDYLKEVMSRGKSQVFIPALFDQPEVFQKLIKELPVSKLAQGQIRGTKCHLDHVVLESALSNLRDLIGEYSQYNKDSKFIIDEIEVNPTVAINGKMWAMDGVMRVSKRGNLPYIDAHKCLKPLENIECLTNPKSIIVAGASAKNMKNPGSMILGKAKEKGLKDIYAIHPSSNSLLGNPAFPCLTDILKHRKGEPVDLISVCIPAKSAGKLVHEAFDVSAAKAIQVVSGGFGETEHGSQMQQKLHDQLFSMPYDKRPVVNGPNTVGNICRDGINTVFVDSTRSNSDMKSGKRNCCLLCQSGAFMLSRISDISPAVLPQIAISVGNQLDLSVTDFLEHYLDNKEITTYGLYIEGLSDGEGIRLMNLVRKAKSQGKCVVIYKAGRTSAGVRAAKGHTAAMAGDFSMFRNLVESAGAIVVDSFEEWNQLIILTTLFPQIMKDSKGRSTGVGVVTNAGFEKCACADHLMANGMEGILHLPQWSPETLKGIDEVFNKYKIGEVVDVSEVLDVTPQFPDKAYGELMNVILKDPGCDVCFLSAVPETQTLHTTEPELDHPEGIFKLMQKMREEYPNKPIIGVFESGEKFQPLRRELNRVGIACFESIDSASRALGMVIRAANQQ